MTFNPTLLALAAAFAAGPAVACYTVHDAQNRVVYKAQEPPVDMSRPLHETMPRAYPGGHLVFGDSLDCPRQTYSRVFLQATSSGPPPLLTDARSAIALGLPHTLVGEGIAMVPHRPDTMRPGVVLAQKAAPTAPGPDTRAMGAAPARPHANPMGIGPARPAGRSNELITEMHNPPLTAVQPAVPGRSR